MVCCRQRRGSSIGILGKVIEINKNGHMWYLSYGRMEAPNKIVSKDTDMF